MKMLFALLSGLLLCQYSVAEVLDELTTTYEDQPALAFEPREPGNWHGLLGGLFFNTDKYLGEKERQSGVLPLIFFSYADTVQWTIGGGTVWFIKSDDHKTRLGAALRVRRGYDADDDTVLSGLAERDRSVEAGLNFHWRNEYITLGAAYYHDVSDTTDGASANLRVSRPMRINQDWTITPGFNADWLSSQVVDYYYGVHTSEVTINRPAFTGQSATNLRASISASYRLAPHWRLLSGVAYTRLGNEISQSPIVNRKDPLTLFIGAGWFF